MGTLTSSQPSRTIFDDSSLRDRTTARAWSGATLDSALCASSSSSALTGSSRIATTTYSEKSATLPPWASESSE